MRRKMKGKMKMGEDEGEGEGGHTDRLREHLSTHDHPSRPGRAPGASRVR